MHRPHPQIVYSADQRPTEAMKSSMINAIFLAACFATPLRAAPLGQTTRLYFSYELNPEEKPGARFWNNTTPLEPNELPISTGFKWDPDNPLVGVLEFKDTNQVKTFQWSSNIEEMPSREVSIQLLRKIIPG